MELTLLAVFAKKPDAGHVKTRLIPPLTPTSAASLHEAFVRDAVALCHTIPGTVCELHTDMMSDAWPDLSVSRKLQIPGNLGLKMLHAISSGLEAGFRRVLILGADAPTLPATHLTTLLACEADLAFGPAEDGGYYAIAAQRVHPEMFTGVEWSTSSALAHSISSAKSSGLSVVTGPVWYDVDEPRDLLRMQADPRLRVHSRTWLAHAGAFSQA